LIFDAGIAASQDTRLQLFVFRSECGHDKLLSFSCKRRGFCPSCGARRMSQTAAHLVDHVIPHVPVRQWVPSLPIPLRLLLAAQPELVTPALPDSRGRDTASHGCGGCSHHPMSCHCGVNTDEATHLLFAVSARSAAATACRSSQRVEANSNQSTH